MNEPRRASRVRWFATVPAMPSGENPPETPARPGWRHRLWPKSVLGITALLLAFSVGASLSGVVLYSYYEYRLDQNEDRIEGFVAGFDERFRTATETIDNEKQNAQAAVQQELEPLRQFQAEGGTLASLVQRIGPSVWFIETLDESGAPSVGSAFVVETNERESVLVGSYATVKAATRQPGPGITLSKGNDRATARLDNWVEDHDLAVMTVPRGNMPKLDWVPQDRAPRTGERIFVASGLGAAGGSVTQGFVSDVSRGAIQHDAATGVSFQGGPLVNSDGQVTGVASLTFAPFGFSGVSGVNYGVPIRDTCERLLRCPAGNTPAAPAPR